MWRERAAVAGCAQDDVTIRRADGNLPDLTLTDPGFRYNLPHLRSAACVLAEHCIGHPVHYDIADTVQPYFTVPE
jgi:hypothetical protein